MKKIYIYILEITSLKKQSAEGEIELQIDWLLIETRLELWKEVMYMSVGIFFFFFLSLLSRFVQRRNLYNKI